MQVKKQRLEPNIEQQTGSKLGKEYVKGVCILSPYFFNLYAEYIMLEMPGWMNHQLKSILLREVSITSCADNTTLMAKSKEELKSLLMTVKEESEKAGLNSPFKKLRPWPPVSLLHGKYMGKNGDCNHKIKRCLPLGRKATTHLDSVLKSRDITLPTRSI